MKNIVVSTSLLLAPLAAQAATTYTYDFTSTFSNNQALNTDGWNDTTGNWVAGSYTDATPTFHRYARNQTGGDSAIYRPNDGTFGFTIPSGTPRVQLTITARTVTFWEAGLAQGTTPRLGIGGDFSNNDKFYIFDNSTRRYETGTSVPPDQWTTIMLDYDLLAGTADLVRDPGGADTLLIDDVALGIPTGTVEAANSLFVRAGNQFAGASSISITVVPEPATLTLGGLGALAFLIRRRRG